MLEQTRLRVIGRVQGVGFRYATLQEAQALKIRGWVKNNEDGSVEILAEGTTAQIETLQKWCAHGPPSAEVSRLEVFERRAIDALSQPEFTIKR